MTKRNVFISYHHEDQEEVDDFLEEFEESFNAKILDVNDEDDFVDSDDADYVMRRIREKYQTQASVTIVLIGECTWARKYVDWEIAASLRNSEKNKRMGLIAITLKSEADNDSRKLPERVSDNIEQDDDGNHVGYARWMKYPTSANKLESWIETARNQRESTPENSRKLRERNSSC